MPLTEYLSPGVFGQEKTPERPTEGISPAKAAFVGWTEKGPVNTPIELRSVSEFGRVFGGLSSLGLVPISQRAFFGNGGERSVVVRVAPADALEAAVTVDPVPSPGKWTFTANGPGIWGNDLVVRIRGNRNFLDRTAGAEKWDKFDVLILQPSDFNAAFLIADETYEAVQFTDPVAADYLARVLEDPRRQSLLIRLTEGLGGTPAGLLAAQITDEVFGTGAPPQTQFTGTLLSGPVLDLSLSLVAASAQIDDEAQTPTPAVDSIVTDFNFTLPTTPVLDGSLRLFGARTEPTNPITGNDFIENEVVTVVGAIDDANTIYTVAASSLSDKVYREGTAFRLKYAATGSATGPNLLHTDGGGGLTHDLSTTPVTVGLSAHPGTVSLSIDIGAGPVLQFDDGAGNFPVTPELPAGGTIDYDSGALTGVTAALLAASTITETHNTSSIITKAAGTDNLELGVVLGGAVVTGTIDLVDSVTTPTGNGALSFTTTVSPTAGTSFFLDFVRLMVLDSDVTGLLTGDTGGGTNQADFLSGVTDASFASAPRTGTTLDADYQSGQLVTDDGLGRLVGDVDPAGNNTIDYATGAIDVTFLSAPLVGTDVLANYTNLASSVDYSLTGGANGSAVTRTDISAAALESTKGGIYALDLVEDPLNVVLPDFEGSEFVQFDLIQFTRSRSDTRYAIMGFANGTTKAEAIQYVLVTQAWDEKTSAMYYPNLFFENEESGLAEIIPITPFVAGVYARTANNKNIGKSPGGIEDGALDAPGVIGVERRLELADRDDLYQSRINPIISSDATGLAVWGVRTLSRDPRWRYVNARQLHMFLMFNITRQLTWAVFENNGPGLWLKIETALKGYLNSLFRLGYFAGELEADAFFVKANRGNNNQSTVNQGLVIIEVGFTPNKPAEFISFTLEQPVNTGAETIL